MAPRRRLFRERDSPPSPVSSRTRRRSHSRAEDTSSREPNPAVLPPIEKVSETRPVENDDGVVSNRVFAITNESSRLHRYQKLILMRMLLILRYLMSLQFKLTFDRCLRLLLQKQLACTSPNRWKMML
jgi:hypothetical protein